jgi:exopolyphosphatase/guanosine-5'-triphosphate,3'-diphosphate pyrophosphatase
MWLRHHHRMPVGVVDVGSNTVRLLVADGDRPLLTLRETLRLGAAVEELGCIPPAKLEETAGVVATFADAARGAGARRLEVLITSPGRQAANGEELLDALAAAAQAPARILSAAEEGRLAFVGALGATRAPSHRRIAVVDVGGGSAQAVVGSRQEGPAWIRSLDLGSLRLTSRLLPDDPPGLRAVTLARAEVEGYLDGFDPPLPRTAIAVGGSARALRRIVGSRLGSDELAEAIELLAATPGNELIELYGLNPHRVRTLTAGAVILAALQRRLDAPLKVLRAGLREGALAELAERRAAA